MNQQHIEYRVVIHDRHCRVHRGPTGTGVHRTYAEAAEHIERYHVGHHDGPAADIESRTVTFTEWTREEL